MAKFKGITSNASPSAKTITLHHPVNARCGLRQLSIRSRMEGKNHA